MKEKYGLKSILCTLHFRFFWRMPFSPGFLYEMIMQHAYKFAVLIIFNVFLKILTERSFGFNT